MRICLCLPPMWNIPLLYYLNQLLPGLHFCLFRWATLQK